MDDKNKFISFDIETLDITINTTLFPPEKKDQKQDFTRIKYALFSTISENDDCAVVENDEFLEFRTKYPKNDREKENINKCRDIAFSFLKFCGIPIIIQSPDEKLNPSYFIDVGTSSFRNFPALAKLLYPEQLELCCVIFGPEIKLYNEVISDFIKVMDGLSPSTNSFRISCFNSIKDCEKNLCRFPIPNSRIPQFAKTYRFNKENNLLEYFKNSAITGIISRIYCYYPFSYVDIGCPEETMIAASSKSESLFLTPYFGELKFICKKSLIYETRSKPIIHFLFRSMKYDDINQNLKTFIAAFACSTNIIIPFSVPCDDLLKIFSLFNQNQPDFQFRKIKKDTKSKLKKRIFLYIEIPEGAKRLKLAANLAFQQLKIFSKMEPFANTELILCQSLTDLISLLNEYEERDITNNFTTNDTNDEGHFLVTKDNLQNGINYFFEGK
ncbi:hypothetical protein M9Y10_011228 [Tritrichomonas musculus]|uniref:Uncharacterized protein n=1 Tax=Tritrichomonas musculus TaxID=1915356 RepID=A0ABR2IIZ8_9EUKA